MVYDCFLFFNELDILDLRLHVLSEEVDYFVIGEATTTFSGEKKPLYYLKNQKLFKEFEDRIIHVTIDDDWDVDTHERDSRQKDRIMEGIRDRVRDEDIILFSDVDEIPNPIKVHEIKEAFRDDCIYSFAQRMYYVYMNMEEVSGKLLAYSGDWDDVPRKQWLGSKACTYGYFRRNNLVLTDLRCPESRQGGVRVSDGGWHFGYMGGHNTPVYKRIIHKIKSAAHQEYNNWRIFIRLPKRLRNLQDLFGRDAEFVISEIDESYPVYLREHLKKYRHYIRKK